MATEPLGSVLPTVQLTIDSTALQSILQSFFDTVNKQLTSQADQIARNKGEIEANALRARQEMQSYVDNSLAKLRSECNEYTDKGCAALASRIDKLEANQEQQLQRIQGIEAAEGARLKREEEAAAEAAAAAEEAKKAAGNKIEALENTVEEVGEQVSDLRVKVDAATEGASAAKACAQAAQERVEACAEEVAATKEAVTELEAKDVARDKADKARRESRVSAAAAAEAVAAAQAQAEATPAPAPAPVASAGDGPPKVDVGNNVAGSAVLLAAIAGLEQELDHFKITQESMITKIKDLESKASSKSGALERKQQKILEEQFKLADKDGDGKVTKEEYEAWLKEKQAAEKLSDGKASGAKGEVSDSTGALPEGAPSWDHKETGGFKPKPAEDNQSETQAAEKVESHVSADVKTFFTDADADGDGTLDLAEWTKTALETESGKAMFEPDLQALKDSEAQLQAQCTNLQARLEKLEEVNAQQQKSDAKQGAIVGFQSAMVSNELQGDLDERQDEIETLRKKLQRERADVSLLHPSKQAEALRDLDKREQELAKLEGQKKRIENAPMDPRYFQKQIEDIQGKLEPNLGRVGLLEEKVASLEELANQAAEDDDEPSYNIETKWLEEINVLHSNIQALAKDKTSTSDVERLERAMTANLNSMKENLKSELSSKAERHDLEEVLKEVVATVESAALEPNEEAKVEALHAALNLVHREMQNKADDTHLEQIKHQLKNLEALRTDPAILGRSIPPPRTASGICLSCDRALDYSQSQLPRSRSASPQGVPASRTPAGVVLAANDDDPAMFAYANEWTKAPHSRANHFYRRGPQYQLRSDSAATGGLPPVDRRHRLKREQTISRGAASVTSITSSDAVFGARSPTRGMD